MPEFLERKLKRQAKKKRFGKERTNAYVFGGLRKTGWVPSTQKKNVVAAREAVDRERKKRKK